jgi:polyhydroxyalkanoate synthase
MTRSSWQFARPLNAAFHQFDAMRRRQGALLDSAGLGRIEMPYRLLHSEPGINLRRYIGQMNPDAPALLIVPAPIKRAYIWDLAPNVSVVRRCIEQGMQVYLAEWTDPDDANQHWGLEDYGNRLPAACLDAIEEDCGQSDVILAGHSLGGVLATTFACRHPDKVAALVLLEAPLHFTRDAGDFAPFVAAAPNLRTVGETFGNVPGSFLTLMSATASPHAFQWERVVDWTISMTRPKALDTCIRVERWTYDEFPMSAQLFSDILELLYRGDRLMNGTLRIGNREIGPKDLRAPLLNVIDPASTVIPPDSILPFHEAAASPIKKVLRYEGDTGIGLRHVGVLVGANAHRHIWPDIFAWLASLPGHGRRAQ